MNTFTLTGSGLEVHYSADTDVLTVDGEGLRGNDREFSGEGLSIVTSELGILITVVLLLSDRVGQQTRLTLLVPSSVQNGDGIDGLDNLFTGAAIIVTDRTQAVNKRHPLQVYDVRQLSGTMTDGKGILAVDETDGSGAGSQP